MRLLLTWLSVLQASIEYMRYLEQCLKDLKAAHAQCDQTSASPSEAPQPLTNNPPRLDASATTNSHAVDDDLDSDSDQEMSEAASPHTLRPQQHHHHQTARSSIHSSHHPSISPAILPSAFTSPAISANPREYSYHSSYSSAQPSPAFEPRSHSSRPSFSAFHLTSPALGPQDRSKDDEITELEKGDAEATAALLMLNTDRRKWSGPSRGMSVKDLLG